MERFAANLGCGLLRREWACWLLEFLDLFPHGNKRIAMRFFYGIEPLSKFRQGIAVMLCKKIKSFC